MPTKCNPLPTSFTFPPSKPSGQKVKQGYEAGKAGHWFDSLWEKKTVLICSFFRYSLYNGKEDRHDLGPFFEGLKRGEKDHVHA